MAKPSTDDLFETLRARGLRRQAARILSDAAGAGKSGAGRSQEAARKIIADLRKVADDLEGRVTGKQTGTDRSEAGKKAARTRARKADARSAAAKKGAATRKARTASSGTASKAKSTAKRTSSRAKSAAKS
jgi:hypothetical protein